MLSKVPFLTQEDRIRKLKQLMAECEDGQLKDLWGLIDVPSQNHTELLQSVITVKNKYGSTILMVAGHQGKVDVVRAILDIVKNRPDFLDIVNTKKNDGNTVLILAAVRGHTQVVNAICDTLKNKPEDLGRLVIAHNKKGQTALMWAEHGNHTSIVKVLRDAEYAYRAILGAPGPAYTQSLGCWTSSLFKPDNPVEQCIEDGFQTVFNR
jgi:ankyrin repeat protein